MECEYEWSAIYFNENYELVKYHISKGTINESRRVKPVNWDKEIKKPMESSVYPIPKKYFQEAALESFYIKG